MPEKEKQTIRKMVRGVINKRKEKNKEMDGKDKDKDKDKEEIKVLSPEAKQKLQNKKEQIKKLYSQSLKIVFILFCFIITFFFTKTLISYKEDKAEPKKQDTNTFRFPVYKKHDALSVFRFSTIRQNEDREFKVQLNSPYLSISAKMFVAYDESKTDIEEELRNKEAEIIAKIQYIIASKNIQDIDTSKKRELNLKPEIINEINSLLEKDKIKDIYFGQFLINQIQVKE